MARIQGRVVDYDTDAPVAGVNVIGFNMDGDQFSQTTTNQSGQFDTEAQGYDSPYSRVRFVKNGYASQEMSVGAANNADVVLPKAGTMPAFALTLQQNKNKIFIIIAIALALFIGYMIYAKKLKL